MSVYADLFDALAVEYGKPACSVVVDDTYFDLSKVAVRVTSEYDKKLKERVPHKHGDLPLLQITEFSKVMPSLMFGSARWRIPDEVIDAWFEPETFLMVGSFDKGPTAMSVVRRVGRDQIKTKNAAMQHAYCVLASCELPEEFAVQHPYTCFYAMQPSMQKYKAEICAQNWRMQISRKAGLMALRAGNGDEELYWLPQVMPVNPARAFVASRHGMYGLVLEKNQTSKYKAMKALRGVSMRSALPPLPLTRRAQKLEEAAETKPEGLVETALEAAKSAPAPEMVVREPASAPEPEPEATAVTIGEKSGEVTQAQELVQPPSEVVAPKKRRKTATTDISGIDFEKLTETLNGAVPDDVDVDAAVVELRNLRDLQLVCARRAANLAMKAITKTGEASKKLKQVMEALGK